MKKIFFFLPIIIDVENINPTQAFLDCVRKLAKLTVIKKNIEANLLRIIFDFFKKSAMQKGQTKFNHEPA